MTAFAAPAIAWRPSRWSRIRAYAGLAAVYLVAYVALNVVTDHRSINATAITLWSPDDALSVLLIMESWTFAPVLWLGQIVADSLFGHAGGSLIKDACAAAVLAAGYAGIAWALRHKFGLAVRAMRPRDMLAVTAVVPVGVAVVGLGYCAALCALGQMPTRNFLSSYAGFWVGDAVAMVVLIPATGALFRVMMSQSWRRPTFLYPLSATIFTLLFMALVVVFCAAHVQNRYLFTLLFLPILLIGVKFGYDAGALALLLVQLLLLAALDFFQVNDRVFAGYQVMMFILAISGQALGATFTEWETATEQLRRQQAELAKVSERATNGVMAAAMSHEISQPLASIAAYLFGARRLLETGQHPDKALAALRKAEGEAARARQIVERLRDFVAKGAVAVESVDLDALVDSVMRWQIDAARQRGVALIRPPREAGAVQVQADRVGVEQAVGNLVLNAIEAAPPGHGEVVVTLVSRDGHVTIGVEDNGAGVAPEVAERLFEPFETTKPRGMGLGLPLAKEIAMRHGGALTWRPLSPRGTRFELELPLA